MTGLALYRGLTWIAAPLVQAYLGRRMARGKEDPDRVAERRGVASRARPDGPLVWLHAASVGEAQSSLALIDALLAHRKDISVLVTSGTVTSARLLEQRLPPRALHQFVPVDVPSWIRRFLDHWRPDLALFVESEIWPNMIRETAARDCPLILVNGRLSLRSHDRWRRAPGTIRALLGCFALCLGQTEEDCRRLAALGARRTEHPGNLKYAAAPLPFDERELAHLRKATAGRTLWLAASTHPGEETVVAGAHEILCATTPGLLTIVAPRHPERGPEIEAMFRQRGLNVSRRAAGHALSRDTDIYLADTLGELGLLYRLTDIAFIGGSMVGVGGHNPLEAAQLDCAILHGPDMANFQTIAADLRAAGAALEIVDLADLAGRLGKLFADAGLRDRLANGARKVTEANSDAVERVIEALNPWLNGLGAGTGRG
jgi:3-deoxy-D-manno-octulosonic-acid transferase